MVVLSPETLFRPGPPAPSQTIEIMGPGTWGTISRGVAAAGSNSQRIARR